MGLNLAKIAALSAASATSINKPAHPQAAIGNPSPSIPIPASLSPQASEQKTAVTTGIASLSALASLMPAAQSAPVESAGTVNFNQVSAQIIELDAAIKAAHPRMPGLLQEIWTTLDKYPECVTLLREDEMEIVISGLEKVVDTDLAAITLKGATSGKKSKTPVSAASLGF